jgi:hypothetical protein
MLTAPGYFVLGVEILDGADQVAFASVRKVMGRGFAGGFKLVLLFFAGF